MCMMTGFIGAGKVGCSLGKYFQLNNLELSGYYDADAASAKEAAAFTESRFYDEPDRLLRESDVLFLTVPDGLIASVWNQIRDLPVKGKLICHCSGALSSGDAFAGIEERGAFGYSIHPLFAVSDKYHSYKELSHAYFTLEGHNEHLVEIAGLFTGMGNQVAFIRPEDKVKYHCAAAICSNHVVALVRETLDLMRECGFEEESALAALRPILLGNMQHIVDQGVEKSLTGPVERADTTTVEKHLNCLNSSQKELYVLLSEILVEIGKQKNPGRDYTTLTKLLQRTKESGGIL